MDHSFIPGIICAQVGKGMLSAFYGSGLLYMCRMDALRDIPEQSARGKTGNEMTLANGDQ